MMKYLAQETSPWTQAQARHLLRRAGFGSTPAGAQQLAAMTREQAIDTIIEDSMRVRLEKPSDIDMPHPQQMARIISESGAMTEEEKRVKRREIAGINRRAVRDLQLFWLERMATSPGFLREKLTLFWHGHFATSAQKVKSSFLNWDMYQRLWTYGIADFHTLTSHVAKSPAMLNYLDANKNVVGKPNENFARELFELFALGIGNYTEKDIKEAARAFTGWASRGDEFIFRQRKHDKGRKKVFGKSGNFQGDDIIALVMEHPAMPRWITAKLWSYFAYENPEDELVDELAAAFVEDRLNVRKLLRRIFLSKAFYSQRAMHSQIKSPIQYLVQLRGDLLTHFNQEWIIVQSMRHLGQSLFYPPNVKGWDGGKAWINSNTLLLRVNVANYMVNGILPDFANRRNQRQREQRQQQNEMANMMNNMAADDPRMMDEVEAAPAPSSRNVRPPLQLDKLLATMEFENQETLVNACVDRFLAMPVEPERMQAFRDEISTVKFTPNGKFSRADDKKIRSMIRMILAMAEYQLC
jgi:uncharacterized protein (DUF1800 family)